MSAQPVADVQRPIALAVTPEHIHADLRMRNQWVLWKYDFKDKTAKNPWTKKPLQLNGLGASSTDSSTWSEFDEALRFYRTQRIRCDGIGFMFTEPFVGVDLDHHRNPETGALDDFAFGVVSRLPGAYVEVSPSGTGIHLIARGSRFSGPRKDDELGLEIYDSSRYFATTGILVPEVEVPNTIPDLSAELEALRGDYLAPKKSVAVNSGKEPSRHDRLMKRAVTLKKAGVERETIALELTALNASFDEPKPADEIDSLVAWTASNVEAAESGEPKASQADRLVTLALAAGVGCLRDGATAYARIRKDNGAHALYPMKSHAFRAWLCRLMYNAERKAANGASVADARNVLEGIALHDPSSEVADVSLRVADSSGDIVLDLGDDAWRCVRISRDGYRVEPHNIERFRRSNTTSALPEPVPGGDLRNLRRFVRCDDESWPLIAAWLIAAVRPKGPYPILVLTGEQGSSKTTTARMLRSIVDPSDLAVRSEPRDAMDLMIAARHSHIVALDNLSRVSQQIADALCCLSTGGGFAKRELYSDAEESVVAVSRPIILTAIEDVATRGDLLDRALIVRLRSIPEEERRTERELWDSFDGDRAELLGAVCSAASLALRQEPEIKQAGVPLARMADFHAWSLAAEPAYAEGISFDVAYRESRESSHRLAIEDSILADPLRQLLRLADAADQERVWHGTATQLLEALGKVTSDETRRRKEWPHTAQAVANALRRIAPALRALGLEIKQDRRSHGGVRMIDLSLAGAHLRKEAQASSPSSPIYEKAREIGVLSGDDARNPSSPERHPSSPIVTSTPATVVTHREPGDDVVTTQKQASSPEKTPPRRGLRRRGDDGDDAGALLPKETDVREGDEVCLL